MVINMKKVLNRQVYIHSYAIGLENIKFNNFKWLNSWQLLHHIQKLLSH